MGKIKNRLKQVGKALIRGLVGIVLLTAVNTAGASLFPMKVSTVPSSVSCERGKDYQLRVYADSTMNPNQTITASLWDVVVPSYVTITGARLPSSDNPSTNPEDFFYNVLMVNNLETNVVSGELIYNWRDSNDGNSGAKDKKGLLEIIDFRINNNAPLGYSNFDLNDIYFEDSDNNVYRSPPNAGVSPSVNTQFEIIPEPSSLALMGIGVLGVGATYLRNRKYLEN